MASDVYFAKRLVMGRKDSLVARLKKMMRMAGLEQILKENALVAVKLHFGELGNTCSIRPTFVRSVVEEIKELRGKPFLVDTNTMYRGSRSNAYDHLITAYSNGLCYPTVGAPVIIGDGLRGKAYHKVAIDGKHFKEVYIADAIFCCDAMVVLTHITGHPGAGLAGTIKNLGMGCSAPAGKRQQHHATKPSVTEEKCIGCGTCIKWCPADAIKLENKKAKIIHEKCIGCGECTVSCPEQAIKITWDENSIAMQEKMAEYAAGAVRELGDKCLFISFLLDITPLCDCAGFSDRPFVPDVGILVSRDPVAIDQASADLVNQQEGIKDSRLEKNLGKGEDKFRGLFEQVDWTVQLRHAESIGLGSRQYNLVEV